jgi:acyl dehydratase
VNRDPLSPSEAVRWYEDVAVGDRLGPLTRETSRLQLAVYTAASRDISLIHLDPELARASGLPDVIVQGSLKAAFLASLATAFAGEYGTVRRLTVQYRGVDVPGTPVVAHGVVERLDPERGFVECRVWLESAAGDEATRGSASIELPRRPLTPAGDGARPNG